MRVDVLLATYNGAPYLAAQLDSVIAQQGVDVRVLVRDDGSADTTLGIVADYVRRYPGRVVLVEDDAPRGGAAANFFRLLEVPSDAHYIAFCDQDDIWLPGKLAAAVTALEALGTGPRLYCSAVDFVDEQLHVIGHSSSTVRPAFANALAENIAQGCTMVFDAGLRRLVAARLPEKATIHDWWMYLVASAVGRVVYDPEPRLQYRQHGGNVVGGGFSFSAKWRKRYRRFVAGAAWKMADQARELLRLYPDLLSREQQDLIRYFVAGQDSIPARVRFLFGWRVWRQSLLETMVVKILVLINAY